jgi:hypothetical protein
VREQSAATNVLSKILKTNNRSEEPNRYGREVHISPMPLLILKTNNRSEEPNPYGRDVHISPMPLLILKTNNRSEEPNPYGCEVRIKSDAIVDFEHKQPVRRT